MKLHSDSSIQLSRLLMMFVLGGFVGVLVLSQISEVQAQDYVSIVDTPIPAVKSNASVSSPQLLCGVNCLYLGLRLLGEGQDYNDLLKAFPKVVSTGVSLEEIQSYLTEKGYESRIKSMNERDLSQIGTSAVALVLLPQGAAYHIVLKKAQSHPEGLLVIDPPSERRLIPAAELSAEPNVTLVFGDLSKLRQSYSKDLVVSVLVGISVVSTSLFVYLRIRKHA